MTSPVAARTAIYVGWIDQMRKICGLFAMPWQRQLADEINDLNFTGTEHGTSNKKT